MSTAQGLFSVVVVVDVDRPFVSSADVFSLSLFAQSQIIFVRSGVKNVHTKIFLCASWLHLRACAVISTFPLSGANTSAILIFLASHNEGHGCCTQATRNGPEILSDRESRARESQRSCVFAPVLFIVRCRIMPKTIM